MRVHVSSAQELPCHVVIHNNYLQEIIILTEISRAHQQSNGEFASLLSPWCFSSKTPIPEEP